jgi:hypothetical protein
MGTAIMVVISTITDSKQIPGRLCFNMEAYIQTTVFKAWDAKSTFPG